MKVLAVDTSTDVCNICIIDGETVVAEYLSKSSVTHTERLMPAIHFLFSKLAWGIQDIDGLAVIHGPGSFTGLRISLSVIKGLSYALKIPVVAANALEVAAHQVAFSGLICPMMDARRGEVFTCLFERRNGLLLQKSEPRSIHAEQWSHELPGQPVHFCGPGASLYWGILQSRAGADLVFSDFVLARSLAMIAHTKLVEGQGINGSEVKAAYLRPSDAETKGPRSPKMPKR